MMRYAIVIEKAKGNYAAYVPDLPGCVATGSTRKETERQIREAIEFHLEGLREDGLTIPKPTSACEYVEVHAGDRNSRANASHLTPEGSTSHFIPLSRSHRRARRKTS